MINLITIPLNKEETTIRKMERLLFPFMNRLIIIFDNSYQIKDNLPFLANLNRSIVLLCDFTIEEDLIKNIPENASIINCNLIDKVDCIENFKVYFRALNPVGIIIFNNSNHKNNIWCEQACKCNINTLNLEPKSTPNIVSLINKKFPYNSLHGDVIDKLFIGCDKYFIDGWLNTDLRGGGEIKYLDISKKMPFGENEFQYIFIEDTIEYFEIDKFIYALSEIYRILRHGGHLRISILNIYFLIDLCLHSEKSINKKYIKWFIDNNQIQNSLNMRIEEIPIVAFDNCMNEAKYISFYDINVIKILLEKCGFKNISYSLTGESNDPVFANIEQRIFTYPIWVNKIKYISVEATKL